MKVEYKLRHSFVCNRCRRDCIGESGECESDYPRKQRIGCLGKHCDDPCELQQTESDLTLDHLIALSKYLGGKLNGLLVGVE
jgi:hypothetical protein